MSAAGVAAEVLAGLGYTNVFTTPPSALVCCEPIVLAPAGWERESRQADGGERGREIVRVLACCDRAADAEATCRAVERDLRGATWPADADVRGRVVSVDTDMPRGMGRDVDDRDVVRQAGAGRRAGATECEAASTERIGREQQRRATAYGRARGRL